jgi:TRAP-type mannitol/chloroaromatic compound transport system permease large subunit
MPPLPPEARTLRGWVLARKVAMGVLPSSVLIFVVLGTIFVGLATPTEAGAMGVVGAIVLAGLHRRLNWAMVREGMESTMEITVMVIFILIGATVFTLVFQGVDGAIWVEHLFTAVGADDAVTFLIVVNIMIFVLAFFLDFFEIAFIVVPLLVPMANKLGIDLIWFGVLICVNMQTSFMHPPFGFALFYLRGIAPPSIKSSDIYMGAIPWVLLQLLLVDGQHGVQLGAACFIELALLVEDVALLRVTAGRGQEGRTLGQRAQSRLPGAQRETLSRAFAHARGGPRLVDLQQQLAGFHHLAFLHQDFRDHAAIK